MIFDVYVHGRAEPIRVWADRYEADPNAVFFTSGDPAVVRARFPTANVDGFVQHDDTHDKAVDELHGLLTDVLGVEVFGDEATKHMSLHDAVILKASSMVTNARRQRYKAAGEKAR